MAAELLQGLPPDPPYHPGPVLAGSYTTAPVYMQNTPHATRFKDEPIDEFLMLKIIINSKRARA